MNVNDLLDEELAQLCATLPMAHFDWTGRDLVHIDELRNAMALVRPAPEVSLTLTTYEDVVVSPRQVAELCVRVYRPLERGEDLPCLYWVHGGGFMFGSALQDDPRLERWCEQFHCVVVSVDYRLAPETPFPGPLEDCYAGLVFAHNEHHRLGIDPEHIVLAGASAGGGLAAGLALMTRDRGEVPLSYQALVYPMLDDRMISASSNMDTIMWPRRANELGWQAYLGESYGGDSVSPYAAPARATSLDGLPPTFISVGDLDLFRDEDLDYATRLIAAGVPTEFHLYPGAPHGFDNFGAASSIGAQAQRDLDDALSRALSRKRRS